ncbi:MAG TPA: 7TM diverse intracellular signaling domain-containing protein [Cytophagaceae bacterium]
MLKKNLLKEVLLVLMFFAHILSYAKSNSNRLFEKDSIPEHAIFYYQERAANRKTVDYIIRNSERLFRLNNLEERTNEVQDPNVVVWLKFSFQSTLENDLIIEFLPFYDRVTLYYFTNDSVMHRHILGLRYPITDRKYLTNSLLARLPSNTLNKYFLKYEFHNRFKVAAFTLRTFEDIFNSNLKNFIVWTILLTSIALIFCLSLTFYFTNKEARYLFYGLYALSFGIFTAAIMHLLYLIPYVNAFSHSSFIYHIPFSLSTIFFSLYIIHSMEKSGQRLFLKVIYIFLAFKGFTLLFAWVDLQIIELIINEYLYYLDAIIYSLVLVFAVITLIRIPRLTHYWLTFGVIVMFIGQMIHVLTNLTTIYNFMCFDILWFGIGLSINYKIAKDDKIRALNDLIQIKSNYNLELENTVEVRTMQLKENIKVIDELNNILKDNNITLSQNVAHLEQVRVLNKELSFEEFRLQFPDKEACLQLLVKIKWNGSFLCNSCGNTEYFQIKKLDPYIRKCTQCGKIHSATTSTLFHNVKFPLEKAFYILFLCAGSKKYTLDSISEMISLRPATIANFKKKVEETMELKRFLRNKDMTWQDLII